ncbi:acyltransferase [Fructilactobacillus fructivorans]|uniref:acyltransferase family protein n=1 Tax=Fructilactobacillus fructivorans TaxID=1614 RepID=UPI00070A2A78|nr:acyltransferase family protein [Fructilactobacillus fructivorans]KRN40895.1 acyltransferase 3 [Fructilactobacillus fructivorans]
MKKRLTYIDVINIIAIFAVLMLHSSQYPTNGIVLKNNIIQAIFIPAIYLFLMNSGATLIGYRSKYDTKFTAFPGPIPHPDPSINDFLLGFLNNNIDNIFWFFYAIILLYLLVPLLSLLVDRHKDLLFYLVILNFIGDFIYIYVIQAYKLPIDPTKIQINPIASVFVGIFIMGYLINTNYFSKKVEMCISVIGICALAFLLISEIFLPNVASHDILGNSPYLFFYVIGVFTLIKLIVGKFKLFNNIHVKSLLAKMASVSLGIYILHLFFFKVFDVIFKGSPSGFMHVFIMPIVTYVLCGLMVYVIKKVPFVKDALP